jgi:hypothetical protein
MLLLSSCLTEHTDLQSRQRLTKLPLAMIREGSPTGAFLRAGKRHMG